MHKTESRDISNRKYLSKTILACRERQAKNLPSIETFKESLEATVSKFSQVC